MADGTSAARPGGTSAHERDATDEHHATDPNTRQHEARVRESGRIRFGVDPRWVRRAVGRDAHDPPRLRFLGVVGLDGLVRFVCYPARDGRARWRKPADPSRWIVDP
jgi:hypothetical protein